MVGLLLMAFISFLFAGLGIPLMLRKVPRNILYGVRTRDTLETPQCWYEANAYAGKLLICYGVVTLLGALILYFIAGDNKQLFAPLLLGLYLFSFMVVTVMVYRYLYLFKKKRLGSDDEPNKRL